MRAYGGDVAGLFALPAVVNDRHAYRWLVHGEHAFAAMLTRIAQAKRAIALEFYICKPGRVAERFRSALLEARERGVEVRLLLDAYGSDEIADGFWDELQRAGGKLRWFNPVRLLRLSFRNHRKLVVADEVAIVGGMNLADEYAGDGVTQGWRDLALEVRGPLVTQITESFERMWRLADFGAGEVRAFARTRRGAAVSHHQAPSLLLAGPGCRSAALRTALYADLRNAREVRAHAAYFLPSRRLRRHLRNLARSGAAVEIMVPARGDVPIAQLATRHAMRRLAGSGVRFSAYRPQMLHSKLLVIDDVVYIGSANLDVRSRLINYELMLRLPVPELAAQARGLFDADLRYAEDIRLETPSLFERGCERGAYWLLARVDPYLARRKLRALQ